MLINFFGIARGRSFAVSVVKETMIVLIFLRKSSSLPVIAMFKIMQNNLIALSSFEKKTYLNSVIVLKTFIYFRVPNFDGKL